MAPVHTPDSSATDSASWPQGVTSMTLDTQIGKERHESFPVRCKTGLAFEAIEIEDAYSPERAVDLSPLARSIIDSCQVLSLPRQTLLRALVDTSTTATFHHCPVFEPLALKTSGSSILLKLAVCLVGNYTRQDQSGLRVAAELYEKIKVLLAIDLERDSVAILQVVCLISQWSGEATSTASLGGPAHWIGLGMRLALEMGLHQENTYASRDDAPLLRRTFWYLHVSALIVGLEST